MFQHVRNELKVTTETSVYLDNFSSKIVEDCILIDLRFIISILNIPLTNSGILRSDIFIEIIKYK